MESSVDILKSIPAITITLSEVVSHGESMFEIGQKSEVGFTYEDLIRIYQSLPEGVCELVNIKDILPKTLYEIPDAYILIIRGQFREKADNLLKIMMNSEHSVDREITGVNWDSTRIVKDRIVENKLFQKLLFLDVGQNYKVPFNPVEKRGTVYNATKIKDLYEFTLLMSSVLLTSFYIEGTNYYNTTECYKPMSQDKKRKKLVNLHLGTSFPINFRWFHNTQAVSDLKSLIINHGDVYIMTDITLGSVKDSVTKLYLKHSLGYNQKSV